MRDIRVTLRRSSGRPPGSGILTATWRAAVRAAAKATVANAGRRADAPRGCFADEAGRGHLPDVGLSADPLAQVRARPHGLSRAIGERGMISLLAVTTRTAPRMPGTH